MAACIAIPLARNLRCGLCGSEFICEGFLSARKCWCSSVKVPVESLERLSTMADDCICPRCLQALSAGKRDE